jgi:hypothetical protein
MLPILLPGILHSLPIKAYHPIDKQHTHHEIFVNEWPKQEFVKHILPEYLNHINKISFFANPYIHDWYRHHSSYQNAFVEHLFDEYLLKIDPHYHFAQIAICSNRGIAEFLLSTQSSHPYYFELLLLQPTCINGFLINPHPSLTEFFLKTESQVFFKKHFLASNHTILLLADRIQRCQSDITPHFFHLFQKYATQMNTAQTTTLLFQLSILEGYLATQLVKSLYPTILRNPQYNPLLSDSLLPLHHHLFRAFTKKLSLEPYVNINMLINRNAGMAHWLIHRHPELIDLQQFATNTSPDAIAHCKEHIPESFWCHIIHAEIKYCPHAFPLWFEYDLQAMRKQCMALTKELVSRVHQNLEII